MPRPVAGQVNPPTPCGPGELGLICGGPALADAVTAVISPPAVVAAIAVRTGDLTWLASWVPVIPTHDDVSFLILRWLGTPEGVIALIAAVSSIIGWVTVSRQISRASGVAMSTVARLVRDNTPALRRRAISLSLQVAAFITAAYVLAQLTSAAIAGPITQDVLSTILDDPGPYSGWAALGAALFMVGAFNIDRDGIGMVVAFAIMAVMIGMGFLCVVLLAMLPVTFALNGSSMETQGIAAFPAEAYGYWAVGAVCAGVMSRLSLKVDETLSKP